jgi:hypothetical protein
MQTAACGSSSDAGKLHARGLLPCSCSGRHMRPTTPLSPCRSTLLPGISHSICVLSRLHAAADRNRGSSPCNRHRLSHPCIMHACTIYDSRQISSCHAAPRRRMLFASQGCPADVQHAGEYGHAGEKASPLWRQAQQRTAHVHAAPCSSRWRMTAPSLHAWGGHPRSWRLLTQGRSLVQVGAIAAGGSKILPK